MPAALVAETGHAVALTDGVVVVGSGAGVQIPIRADLGVGPRHFDLTPCGGGSYRLRSLADEWAVQVNGAPVFTAVLLDGDVITAGALHLTFRRDPDAVRDAPPEPALVKTAPQVIAEPALSATMTLTRPMPAKKPIELGLGTGAAAAEDDAPRPHAAWTAKPPPAADIEHLEGFSEKSKQRFRTQKLMQENQERTQRHLERMKDEQDFNHAFAAALVAVALGAVVYYLVAWLPWKFFLPVAGAIGLVIGWFVRISGKGIEPRFGHLAAAAGLCTVCVANFCTYQWGASSAESAATAVAMAEKASYAGASVAKDVIALVSEDLESKRREMERPALFDPTQLDPPDRHAPVATSQESPALQLAVRSTGEPAPPTTATEALLALFLSPRSLVACLLVSGTAWRSAFRRLSDREASDLHRTVTERAPEDQNLPLRERIRLGMGKEPALARDGSRARES